MKSRLILILLACTMLLPLNANGQVGSMLKNKLKSAATGEADKKVENKTVSLRDKLLGNIVGEDTTDTQGPGGNPGVMQGLFGGANVPHKELYQFDGKILMMMETYDDEEDGADAVIEYTTYLNTKTSDIAIEIKPISGEAAQTTGGATVMNMIYDRENNTMLIITNMEGQKNAIASSLDNLDDYDTNTGEGIEPSDNATYKKTGATKTIAGYKCDEYEMQDGENTGLIWVTRDLPFKISENEMKNSGIPAFSGGPFEGGMMMEMEVFEAGVKKMYMIVKEVDTRATKSISMEGFTFMNMNMGR
ncbi:MAG: DUF4412 domain-containing protein [Bacteroidales bacterium]